MNGTLHFLRPACAGRLFALLALSAALAGCAMLPQARPSQEAGPAPAEDAAQADLQLKPAPPQARAPEPAEPAPAVPAAPPGPAKAAPAPAEAARTAPRLLRGSGTFVKQEPAAAPARPAGQIALNFEGADIREVAKTILADILREGYVVDPKVQGSVTLRTLHPLPREALIPTLETLLKVNGAILVREAGLYKILPTAAARGSLSPQVRAAQPGYSVQVVPLRYISAREMAKLLEPFAPEGAILRIDEVRNLLILAGAQAEIGHMLDTIDTFDVDWLSGMSVGLFPLKSADVKTLNADLEKIFGDKAQSPLAGLLRIIPIERMNAFVVITPQPEYLDKARDWIEKLDRENGIGGKRLFVYRVQNTKAEALANLMTQLFGSGPTQATTRATAPSLAPGLSGTELRSSPGALSGLSSPATQTPAATPQPPAQAATLNAAALSDGLPSDIKIIADHDNNALLVFGTLGEYERIEAALKTLDVPPRQVLIEATIAEVTLTGDLQYGVEWLFSNGPRQQGKLDLGAAGLLARVPGFSYAWRNDAGAIRAVLNMLATNSKLNVLSAPHIMVADNQSARIQVGDSVPIAGPQAVTGTGVVTTSVQYVDTGVILTVTPSVNAGGLVSLDISQEVSIAAATDTSNLNSPTISKRTTKSRVLIQSGETMVLGGLISERRTDGASGIPFLSEIPVIGALFGNQSRTSNKTELIVLITPRVVHDASQARLITDEFKQQIGKAGELFNRYKQLPPPQAPREEFVQ